MEIFGDIEDNYNDNVTSGKVVSYQKQIWFDLISARICINAVLDKINILPSAEQMEAFKKEMKPEEKKNFENMQKLSNELEETLLELANTIYINSPKLSHIKTKKEKDTEDIESEKIFKKENADKIDEQVIIPILPNLYTEIEEWQRTNAHNIKTSKSGNNTISSASLSVIDQPFSNQVDYVLRDIDKVASRFHLNSCAFAPYGIIKSIDYATHYGTTYDKKETTEKAKYTEQFTKIDHDKEIDYADILKKRKEEEEKKNITDIFNNTKNGIKVMDDNDKSDFGMYIERFNPENKIINRRRMIPSASPLIFCDQEFYTQLLQELALNGGNQNTLEIIKKLNEARRKKQAVKKNYEKKVTKNRIVNTRKIHKKLINFMAPIQRPSDEELMRMRGRLFGKSIQTN